MGNFLKPLATSNLPKSTTFLGNFCEGVKIFHFSSEIIFGQHLAIFFWSRCSRERERERVLLSAATFCEAFSTTIASKIFVGSRSQ